MIVRLLATALVALLPTRAHGGTAARGLGARVRLQGYHVELLASLFERVRGKIRGCKGWITQLPILTIPLSSF